MNYLFLTQNERSDRHVSLHTLGGYNQLRYA